MSIHGPVSEHSIRSEMTGSPPWQVDHAVTHTRSLEALGFGFRDADAAVTSYHSRRLHSGGGIGCGGDGVGANEG
jgi:hypothetical protein